MCLWNLQAEVPTAITTTTTPNSTPDEDSSSKNKHGMDVQQHWGQPSGPLTANPSPIKGEGRPVSTFGLHVLVNQVVALAKWCVLWLRCWASDDPGPTFHMLRQWWNPLLGRNASCRHNWPVSLLLGTQLKGIQMGWDHSTQPPPSQEKWREGGRNGGCGGGERERWGRVCLTLGNWCWMRGVGASTHKVLFLFTSLYSSLILWSLRTERVIPQSVQLLQRTFFFYRRSDQTRPDQTGPDVCRCVQSSVWLLVWPQKCETWSLNLTNISNP